MRRRGQQQHNVFFELEGIRGPKGTNNVCLSFSFGSSGDDYGSSTAKKSTEATPDDWTSEQVAKWLTDDLKLSQYAALFVENDITGNELKYVGSEDLKALGIKSIGHSLRIQNGIRKLQWKPEVSLLQETQPVRHHNISLMKNTDIASPELMEACWSKRVIPKGYVKIFREPPGRDNAAGGGGGGGLAFGLAAAAGGDTSSAEQSTPNPEPYFLVELTGVQVTSVQQSGSSSTPCESVSLSFTSIAFHYRDLSPDAFAETAGGISVHHDIISDKVNLVKFTVDGETPSPLKSLPFPEEHKKGADDGSDDYY